MATLVGDETIVVPLRRDASVKASISIDSTTAGSSSPKQNIASTSQSSFQSFAFEINPAFAKNELVVTRLIPTRFREFKQPFELQRRPDLKSRVANKVKAIKKTNFMKPMKQMSFSERMFHYTIL